MPRSETKEKEYYVNKKEVFKKTVCEFQTKFWKVLSKIDHLIEKRNGKLNFFRVIINDIEVNLHARNFNEISVIEHFEDTTNESLDLR